MTTLRLAAFKPGGADGRGLEEPYVSVSADVVVAEDDATARELSSGYPAWVRSIRTGAGATVAERLAQLRDATGADELAITTITHRHDDRVRSYELLAEAWI